MDTSSWIVQGSVDGKTWQDMTAPYADRDAAMERLSHFRAAAQPSITYRLVCDATVITRTVEEA